MYSIDPPSKVPINLVVAGEDSESSFLLVLQTKAQKDLMSKYGNDVTLMDGIYRTTKYGFPCIFLTVKTSIGSGMVVATIIPQYENEALLAEGLTILKQWNPLFFVTFTEVKHGRGGYQKTQMTSIHKTEVLFWSN